MLIKATSSAVLPSAAATTNATSVKASNGYLFHVIATNTTAIVKYLKIYNKASAPVVGTDVPFMTIALPPSNAPAVINLTGGLYLSAGIAYAITGAAANSDTTVLTAGDVVGINLLYN